MENNQKGNDIMTIIINLWNIKFPDDAKNRKKIMTSNDKKEVIDFYIERIDYCNKLSPKDSFDTHEELLNTKYSESDHIRLYFIQAMKMEIFKDIKKNKFCDEIMFFKKN
jgi:hypothetical protein